ncbi:cytochrome P450 4C1 [Monomorium pharaonis]|uniref:cytochrome P450 4C1 n=1 Tax=Monomorium pharaonis TaxID=307658 RepID=UPI00063F3F12|nr:cytochrome P450 4C1 [Monomorium pharaonis]XP_012543160.1 cytochrome P450 4C1 [Monomorium pharaonis]
MIFALFLLSVFLVLLYYSFQYVKFAKLINKIPGLPSLPIIGHSIDLICSQEDLWKLQRLCCKTYYPMYKFWLGPIAFVSVHDPDDLEKVLSSPKEHLSKGYMYTFFKPWLGTGLLISEGTKWHKRRRILTPAFHFKILKQFVEILINEGNRMTKSLKDIKGSVDDLMFFVSEHSLNVICETAMGTSLREMGKFEYQYREAVHEIGKIIVYRVMRPWLTPDIIFALTSEGRKHAKYLKILHSFTDKIIAERKKYHESTDGRFLININNDKNIADDEVTEVTKKRLAMLDLLIAVARNNEMNDLDIREEVDTFMFEGHDTVAMGLTFAILMLAEHKDVQERIRNEVSALMQANEGKITISTLNDMTYLERCLKESLRLYPSVPFISRVLSEDVNMKSYLVPSGTVLHINIYDIHRDPNFWPNPDVFDPDRFLPERIQKRHPYSYLPFSAGPRNCIGQRFAMMELKAIMASLIYNFYLEPVDYLKDLQFKTDIISRVTKPIRARFVPIDRTDSFKVM